MRWPRLNRRNSSADCADYAEKMEPGLFTHCSRCIPDPVKRLCVQRLNSSFKFSTTKKFNFSKLRFKFIIQTQTISGGVPSMTFFSKRGTSPRDHSFTRCETR